MSAIQRLELVGAAVRFGRLTVLDDVSIALSAGECVGIAGPNGCGKSTLIRVLLGLVRPDAAMLRIDGVPRQVDNALKAQLGYLPEMVAFADSLSGLQVLRFIARARAVERRRTDAVLERIGLADAARRAVRGYSRGMRQRLGLGVAILAEPTLLILDEPTGGLDQQGLAVLRDVLDEWKRCGRMALVATHDLALMEPRLDRICLLQDGRVLADETPSQLRQRAALPVRVSFALQDDLASADKAAFATAISSWGRSLQLEQRNGNIDVVVPADQLLGLVDVQRPYQTRLRSMRVHEPGMDQVYDELVRGKARASEPRAEVD
ncbi:MAG: ABC transporter ATP-binding protein [Deltaproteobacteria bacterium]|nr:ABC transporter ATP-binding protein [Deltaproteobacteria bacterium]